MCHSFARIARIARIARTVGAIALSPTLVLATGPGVPDFLERQGPKASILLLGTFHFKDAGLDSYKPQHDVDILSEKRQGEVAGLLELLAAFRPTKIAVEVGRDRQEALNVSYRSYVAGEKPLSSNEVHQLGFRLARQLGHERLWAVDAPARSYFPDMTEEKWEARQNALTAKATAEQLAAEQEWDDRFMSLYAYEDELKTRMTLGEFLLYRNAAERVLQGHGHYLIGSFKLGDGSDYFGADIKTRWYNRNLRIFHNLTRITDTDQERILLIIGAGHLPILRHCVQASPQYQLVELADYLRPETETPVEPVKHGER